jgi:uncharacterized protein
MSLIGTVETLWRYPVKSMRGAELDELFAGYAGVYGDRLFAFESSASPKGFPFFTGREQRQMIRYRPRFRNPDKAARPVNWSEAEKLPPGVNPISAAASELMIDVETPDGETFAIDDPALIDNLRANIDGKHELTLLRSDKAITDCRPLSIFAVQSAKKLGEETGVAVDKRRFRANVYLDLSSANGFAENEFCRQNIADRIQSRRVGAGARSALHDDHARSGHGGENARDLKSSRTSARRHGRRLRRGACRRHITQRRSRRVA